MEIIPRRKGQAEHVARRGGIKMHTLWLESLNGRDQSGDQGVDGRLILKGILPK